MDDVFTHYKRGLEQFRLTKRLLNASNEIVIQLYSTPHYYYSQNWPDYYRCLREVCQYCRDIQSILARYARPRA